MSPPALFAFVGALKGDGVEARALARLPISPTVMGRATPESWARFDALGGSATLKRLAMEWGAAHLAHGNASASRADAPAVIGLTTPPVALTGANGQARSMSRNGHAIAPVGVLHVPVTPEPASEAAASPFSPETAVLSESDLDAEIRASAVSLARQGFRVVPVHRPIGGVCNCSKGAACGAAGKHPIGKGWPDRASSDVEEVRKMFARGGANVGLVMGGPDRLVALDVDGEKGRASLAALEAELGALPPTWASRSGRADGGEHRVFRVPMGVTIRNQGGVIVGGQKRTGLDLRSDNGHIVGPGSLHASGSRYARVAGSPDESADLPEAWANALPKVGEPSSARGTAGVSEARHAGQRVATPTSTHDLSGQVRGVSLAERTRRGRAYITKRPGGVAGEDGSGATFQAALDLTRGLALPVDAALEIMTDHYNPRCEPPWTPAELAHKVNDAAKGNAELGYLLMAPVAVDEPPEKSLARPLVETPDGLSRSKAGTVKNTLGNLVTILASNPIFAGAFAWNEMSASVEMSADHTSGEWTGRPLADSDYTALRVDVERRYGFAPGEENAVKAVELAAQARRYHPVRAYLDGLVWDGVPRIPRFVSEVLHGDPTALHLSYARKWFVGMVARVMRPGCKVDTALVLKGPQGVRKSSLFRALTHPWFTDTDIDLHSKDAYLTLGASWCLEWGELNTMNRASRERVKSFLSSSEDLFRSPYARGASRVPRTAVVVGTTNDDGFLSDPTGSRRFWILPVGAIDLALAADWRDQLWAEAAVAFGAGEPWWLDADEDERREDAAGDYEDADPWTDNVLDWAAGKPPFTTAEVLVSALQHGARDMDRRSEMRVADILKRGGYVRARNQRTLEGRRVRCWTPAQPSRPAQSPRNEDESDGAS